MKFEIFYERTQFVSNNLNKTIISYESIDEPSNIFKLFANIRFIYLEYQIK